MIAKQIAHYRLLDPIGRGGMAVVYRAKDLLLGREVAVKLLPERFLQDPAARDRFRREARAASTLSHRGICTTLDIGEQSGQPFIVMELLQGETLRHRISEGPVPLARALDYSIQILQSIQFAHSLGIVHRDIKPENIFLTQDDKTKILDFGLAKLSMGDRSSNPESETALTTPGTILGTVCYMSPEQVRDDPVDARTDLYSFGLVLYEMTSGLLPTQAKTAALVYDSILNKFPAPPSSHNPSLPASLDPIVMKSLRKDPEFRYSSAEEMANALERVRAEALEEPSNRSNIALTTDWGKVVPSEYRLTSPDRHLLIGRDQESNQLHGSISSALGGRGSLVLIDGEPGIGKTRMLEVAIGFSREAGLIPLIGHCTDLEGSLPYLPFVEVLESLFKSLDRSSLKELLGDLAPEIAKLSPLLRHQFPDIPPAMQLPPEQERHLLFSSFAEFLDRVSASRPVLLALEDLHWADRSSASLLSFLAPRLTTQRVLIVGTYRSLAAQSDRPFASCREELLRRRLATTMLLKPLLPSEVSAVLRKKSKKDPPERVTRLIYEVTEGNPFFVDEIYDYLAGEGSLYDKSGSWRNDLGIEDLKVTEGIRLLLNRRLKRLKPQTVDILQFGALIGRSFSFDLLSRACGQRPEVVIEALEEAGQNSQVFARSSGNDVIYTFSHALIRRNLLETISLLRRRQNHLRIADTLESMEGISGAERIVDLAHHLTRAGSIAPPEKVAQYVSQAGDIALGKAAFEEAIRLYDRALEFRTGEELERAELLFKRGSALTGIRCWPEAQKTWSEALDLYQKLGEKTRFGETSSILAAQYIWAGNLDQSLAASRRGLRVLDEGPHPLRCRLLAWAGHSLNQGGNMRSGSELTAQALSMAEHLQDGELLGHVQTHRACQSFYSMDFNMQVDAASQAAELTASIPWDRAEALAILCLGLVGVGELEKCKEITPQLFELTERIGHVGSLWMGRRVIAMVDLLESGDLRRFCSAVERDLEFCKQAGFPWTSEAYTWRGLGEFWQGDWAAAENSFRVAVRLEPSDFSSGFDWSQFFVWLCYTGRRDEAMAEYAKIEKDLPRVPETIGQYSRVIGLTHGLAMLGEFEKAATLYPSIARLVERGTRVCFNGTGLVDTAAGIAASCAGLWDKADDHFRRAIRLAENIPHQIERGDSRRWYAQMLRRRNDSKHQREAARLLRGAQEVYSRLGMSRHSEMVRSFAR